MSEQAIKMMRNAASLLNAVVLENDGDEDVYVEDGELEYMAEELMKASNMLETSNQEDKK